MSVFRNFSSLLRSSAVKCCLIFSNLNEYLMAQEGKSHLIKNRYIIQANWDFGTNWWQANWNKCPKVERSRFFAVNLSQINLYSCSINGSATLSDLCSLRPFNQWRGEWSIIDYPCLKVCYHCPIKWLGCNCEHWPPQPPEKLRYLQKLDYKDDNNVFQKIVQATVLGHFRLVFLMARVVEGRLVFLAKFRWTWSTRKFMNNWSWMFRNKIIQRI